MDLTFVFLLVMKKAFHKTASFLMALVVLFSTMSFTMSSHYCGDSLVDSSIFSNLKSCGMESETTAIDSLKSSDCSITKKGCCSEETEIVKGQDELQLTFEKASFEQQIFVAVFLNTYNNLFELTDEVQRSIRIYPPPLIVKQIFKLDETYLI